MMSVKNFLILLLSALLFASILFVIFWSDSGIEKNEEICYKYFVAKGLSPVQSAAIVGNLIQESSCNPKALNSSTKAFGIAQWLDTRKSDLYAFAEKDRGSRSVNDIMLQLDFIWHELSSGDEMKVLDDFKKQKVLATSVDGTGGAVQFFCIKYERCSEEEEVLARRLKYANNILKEYGPKE